MKTTCSLEGCQVAHEKNLGSGWRSRTPAFHRPLAFDTSCQPAQQHPLQDGGSGGTRTPRTRRPDGLATRCVCQFRHTSKMAGVEGIEPSSPGLEPSNAPGLPLWGAPPAFTEDAPRVGSQQRWCCRPESNRDSPKGTRPSTSRVCLIPPRQQDGGDDRDRTCMTLRPTRFPAGALTSSGHVSSKWWAARESNPPGDKPHRVLNPARLPASPAAREWWDRAESNRRHAGFSVRCYYRLSYSPKMVGRGGIEPRARRQSVYSRPGISTSPMHSP